MDDHRALITQLCAELDHCRRCILDDRRVTHPLADRARAVLAHQPDFRALCAELLLFSEQAGEICTCEGLWPKCDPNYTLLNRANAALAADGPAVQSREPASVALEATEQAQPLWKVMRTAYDCSTAPNGSTGDWIERDGFAAEIRAVAEWLVPEEEPLPDSLYGGNRFDRQAERQRLRALLTTEADRAERGDG